MKLLFCLLLPLCSFSQTNFQAVIDVGLTSGATFSGRVGAQLFVMRGGIVDMSFRHTQGTNGNYFVEAATGGFTHDFEKIRLIATAGPYYHQYATGIEKGQYYDAFLFGGQFQMQYGVGICGLEYNGRFATLSVGFALFHPKAPNSCVY